MTMKRFLTLLFLLSLGCNMWAQDGYHNSNVGSTLKWVIHDGSGALFGYCHETLVKMEGDMDNARIDYSYMFYDEDNQSVIGTKPFEFYVTIEDGKTRAYVNNVVKAKQSGDYMPVGDISSIPDDIKVGDNLRATEIQVKVLTVFTARNIYNNRSVTARESVEVPAGCYDCFLVEDDEFFTGAGPFHVKTWVAKGTGIVKQIIYKKDGSVNQVFELVK
jgi:hypothetical protein